MKTKPTVVTLLLLLALALTLSANNVAIEAHAQTTIGLLQDFCDDYAPVTLVDEEEYEASDYTTITDFAGNSYYYSTVSPQGYIIMHAATQNVVEASFDDADPFDQIASTGERFYAGPGQYFRKLQNDDDEWVYRSYIGQDYAFDDETLVAMSTELNTQMTTADTRTSTQSTPNPSHTSTDSDGFTYVKGYEYFEKLNEIYWDYYAEYGYDGDYVSKDEYVIEVIGQADPQRVVPWNDEGTCGFNALVMVLGYMSVVHNPSIIPSNYVYTVKDSEYYNGGTLNVNFYDINIDSVQYLPVISEELLRDVVRYVYPTYPDLDPIFGYYAWSGQLEDAMDGYITNKIPTLSNNLVQYCGTIFENKTKWDIDNGRPSILSMWNYTVKDNSGNVIERKSNHCMIAYGYKGNMYKATDPNLGNTRFISTGLIFTNYSIGYIGNHVHSDTLRFKNHGCWGTYCPCGHRTCTHSSGVLNSNHGCISCGVVYHPWVYTDVYTASVHQLRCTLCNVTFNASHILKPGPLGSYYCSCGYDTSDFGEIALGNPEHDEDL